MSLGDVGLRGRQAVLHVALATLTILFVLGTGSPAAGQGHVAIILGAPGDMPLAWLPSGGALIAGRSGETLSISEAQALQLTELWMAPLQGAPRQLTRNGVQPAVSPDGQRLAYLSYVGDGLWSTVTMDLATYVETRGEGRAWDAGAAPRWEAAGSLSSAVQEGSSERTWRSPDGRYVAEVTADFGPSVNLWVRDARDGNLRIYLEGERWILSRLSWSPDSRQITFSRTAPGTQGDGQLCRLDVIEGTLTIIGRGQGPLWSPDGRWIAFAVSEGVRLLPADSGPATSQELAAGSGSAELTPIEANVTGDQLTPPATIRVVHWSYNTCRPDVPIGQIDTIGFEEYVRRVVPHEVYLSWPSETLKAQAVAARSFGWWYTLRPAGSDYDLSDTTYHQYMCDSTDPRSDAAVDATRGQYVAYQGQVAFAQFSAENGSPTRDGSYPYLRAIDDPMGFGRRREDYGGHGWGMSQWGAQRWAERYKWNYEQILTHYYTGVTVERPASGLPGPVAPAGSLVRPWLGWYVNANRLWLRANASDGDGDLAGVDFAAQWLDAAGRPTQAALGAAGRADDGWYRLWDVSALPDQGIVSDTLVITGTVSDASERRSALGITRIGLDRVPPSGQLSAPSVAFTTAISLTVTSANDATSGVEGVLISNNWRWEGESSAIGHEAGTGIAISDTAALNGSAWVGRAGTDRAGAWFGPYTYALPGGRPYRALFRLKTDAITQTAEIATLDVVDNAGGRLLGLRRLRGIDFQQANTYQEFGVDFYYWDVGTAGLEFRIAFRGVSTLYYDRVLVTSAPITVAQTIPWELPAASGRQPLQAKLADRAGNVSMDQELVVQVITPTPSPTPAVTSTPTPTPSVTATSSPPPTATRTATPTPSPPPTATRTATPTPSPTTTPVPSPTATAPPVGEATIHMVLGSIFADTNANGVWDAGEPALTDVRLQFLDAQGRALLPGVTAGSWSFLVSVPVGHVYHFVATRVGFQTRVENVVAPSAPGQLELNWLALGLSPWSRGAILPLVLK